MATHALFIDDNFDAIIIGAGIGGSLMAHELTAAGKRVLILEAGREYKTGVRPERGGYPREEIDANAQLYWGGGVELNATADLGILRPKCVGGGSVVNQALVDRFDDIALDSWREAAGMEWLSVDGMAESYARVESYIKIQEIPAAARNGNALIFERGFAANGYVCAPLKRAQSGCRNEEGNDCIECLAGCPIESKQSAPWTTLARARATGRMTLLPEFEVQEVHEDGAEVAVSGVTAGGLKRVFRGSVAVLASGAIGNSALLLRSAFGSRIPALGTGFYTHPQYMVLARYKERIDAHKKSFQGFKSDDPGFRQAGFKLENIFAPPVAIATLLPGVGREHHARMENITHTACIEVAVRDTAPGRVRLGGGGRTIIEKVLNDEDRRRRDAGFKAIENIFRSTGAKDWVVGGVGIGLHLMGGCALGRDPLTSVVGEDFRVHGTRRVFAADSSLFPNAPGINPSLTVMALAYRAAQEVARAC